MTMPVIAGPMAALVFAALLLRAGLGDVATMQISNRLVLTMLVAYAVFAPFAGLELLEIGKDVAAALAVLIFAMIFFALGWIGGGDGKLAAAAALWLGAANIFAFVTYTALAGGVLAFAILVFRRVELTSAWEQREWVARLRGPDAGLPYGVAIATGALLALPGTSWLTAQAF